MATVLWQHGSRRCIPASVVRRAAQVIVATGFIAKNQAGQVTTLKRNGSDYSATIMGALVRSANIVIWTDVDGVFSADPRKVPCPCQIVKAASVSDRQHWHKVYHALRKRQASPGPCYLP